MLGGKFIPFMTLLSPASSIASKASSEHSIVSMSLSPSVCGSLGPSVAMLWSLISLSSLT